MSGARKIHETRVGVPIFPKCKLGSHWDINAPSSHVLVFKALGTYVPLGPQHAFCTSRDPSLISCFSWVTKSRYPKCLIGMMPFGVGDFLTKLWIESRSLKLTDWCHNRDTGPAMYGLWCVTLTIWANKVFCGVVQGALVYCGLGARGHWWATI